MLHSEPPVCLETFRELKITVRRKECHPVMSHQHRGYHKTAKKSKDEGKALDRISSLPDEILGSILSCLPPKSAVATSLLSRRWKYLFRFTTKLHFNDSSSSIGHTNFKKFVHLFLAFHQTSPVKEFGLDCEYSYDTSDLHVWISAALLKDVQQLYLHLRNDFYRKEQRLPISLFSSKSLQVLKINADIDLVVPKTVCLPNLKVLNFTGLTFDDGESFGRVFSGCTSLEVLTFSKCEFVARKSCFCICSPTLQCLTFNECEFETIKIDAPSLQHATHTYLYDTFFWRADNSLKHEFAVTCLSLKQITYRRIAAPETPAYLNLALLKLGWCHVLRWKDLIDILCNSPRLKTIIFDQGLIYRCKGDDEGHRRLEERLKESKAASLSIHAEVIEVHSFSGNEIELYVLEHLLQMAIKLKRLILYKDRKMNMKHELQMAKQLLVLPKASGCCRIELV